MTRFEMCDDIGVYNYKWRFVVKSIKVFDIFGRSNKVIVVIVVSYKNRYINFFLLSSNINLYSYFCHN